MPQIHRNTAAFPQFNEKDTKLSPEVGTRARARHVKKSRALKHTHRRKKKKKKQKQNKKKRILLALPTIISLFSLDFVANYSIGQYARRLFIENIKQHSNCDFLEKHEVKINLKRGELNTSHINLKHTYVVINVEMYAHKLMKTVCVIGNYRFDISSGNIIE